MRSEPQVRSSRILARWIQHDGPSCDTGLGSNDTQNHKNQIGKTNPAMHRVRGNEAEFASAFRSEKVVIFRSA